MLKSLIGLLAAMTLAAPATAAPKDPNRLFADSKLVVRDRFSDEIVGKGPDIVFIPGVASSRATWKATAERLRATHRVHLIQVAGFAGETPRANAEGEVFAPTAEALDAYLVERKLTKATLVGHSLGGSMALYIAQRRPDHVAKVMVVDMPAFLGVMMGGPRATPESVKPIAIAIRDAMTAGGETYAAGLKDQIARMVTAEPDRRTVTDWSLASDPGAAGRAYYEVMQLDLRPGLAAMRMPVTVLHGDNAAAGAPADAMAALYRASYKGLEGATLKQVDGSLHFITFDQPAAFAAALDAFLVQP